MPSTDLRERLTAALTVTLFVGFVVFALVTMSRVLEACRQARMYEDDPSLNPHPPTVDCSWMD